MEIDVFGGLVQIWHGITDSYLFLFVKFFLFVYISVLIVDIILLLMLRDLSMDFKKLFFAAERPLVRKSKIVARWEAILQRLDSDNPAQYKAAILEADQMADEVLMETGFHGANMSEKLASARDGQIETKPLLMEAHEVRNKIVNDPNFEISQEEARRIVENYRQFFDEVELFS